MLSCNLGIYTGRVWKFGDSINTDIISPGGTRGEELLKTCMAAIRPEFPSKVIQGDILVAGENFGCGSHRESANLILKQLGIQAIVAESFARIFYRIGVSIAYPAFIVPMITSIVEDGDTLEINYPQGLIVNKTNGKGIKMEKFPLVIKKIYNAGGLIPDLFNRYEKMKQRMEEIDEN